LAVAVVAGFSGFSRKMVFSKIRKKEEAARNMKRSDVGVR